MKARSLAALSQNSPETRPSRRPHSGPSDLFVGVEERPRLGIGSPAGCRGGGGRFATAGWLRRRRRALQIAQAGAKSGTGEPDGSAGAPNPGTSQRNARRFRRPSRTRRARGDRTERPKGDRRAQGVYANGWGSRYRPDTRRSAPARRAKEVRTGTNE